jgi:hypothetical protein
MEPLDHMIAILKQIIAIMKVHQEAMEACLGKMEARIKTGHE